MIYFGYVVYFKVSLFKEKSNSCIMPWKYRFSSKLIDQFPDNNMLLCIGAIAWFSSTFRSPADLMVLVRGNLCSQRPRLLHSCARNSLNLGKMEAHENEAVHNSCSTVEA